MVLAGTAYGRVRAMLDYTGARVKDADPGSPSEILGLSGVPEAGDILRRHRRAPVPPLRPSAERCCLYS